MATALVEPKDVLAKLETNPGIRCLRALARELGGIAGYSKMAKAELEGAIRRTANAKISNQNTYAKLTRLIDDQFDRRINEFRRALMELVDQADALASRKAMEALQNVLSKATLTDEELRTLPELLRTAEQILEQLQEKTQEARALIEELRVLLNEGKVVVEERRTKPSRIGSTLWEARARNMWRRAGTSIQHLLQWLENFGRGIAQQPPRKEEV